MKTKLLFIPAYATFGQVLYWASLVRVLPLCPLTIPCLFCVQGEHCRRHIVVEGVLEAVPPSAPTHFSTMGEHLICICISYHIMSYHIICICICGSVRTHRGDLAI